MPGKSLNINIKQQNSAHTDSRRFGAQKLHLLSSVSTKKQDQINNFLHSPGALQRSESKLSMSLLKKAAHKPSLSSGPCQKIQEVDEGSSDQVDNDKSANSINDPRETLQQLHCLKNMLKKKQKIRAPPSYKNRCHNCHILNMTVFKKATPQKQQALKNQQRFEKLIDEQVFSDDESDIEVNESMQYSLNTSFLTVSND